MTSAWVITSSERPGCSMRSTCVNGSSRAPNRDFVRRTPLATARTRPVVRARMVMIRSASPSFWVRSTIPSSRYGCTRPLSRTMGSNRVKARKRGPCGRVPLPRQAWVTQGLAALAAVDGGQDGAHRGTGRVGVHADAPVDLAADLALHVRRGLGVGALGEGVLGVIQHPGLDAEGGQGVAEGGD